MHHPEDGAPVIGLLLAASGLLVVAGAAKVARPHDTARALGVPVLAVRAAAAVEVVIGGLAFFSSIAAYAVAASYVGFGVFVLLAVQRGTPLSSCGCFGEPDTPPTIGHGLVDLVLAAGSFGAAPGRSMIDRIDPPIVALGVVTAGLAYLVMVRLPRVSVRR